MHPTCDARPSARVRGSRLIRVAGQQVAFRKALLGAFPEPSALDQPLEGTEVLAIEVEGARLVVRAALANPPRAGGPPRSRCGWRTEALLRRPRERAPPVDRGDRRRWGARGCRRSVRRPVGPLARRA